MGCVDAVGGWFGLVVLTVIRVGFGFDCWCVCEVLLFVLLLACG